MKGKRRHPREGRQPVPSLLKHINPNAAGIDCGAREHYVAVPPDRDPCPVRAFKTFTADLHQLADWLAACGVTTVALEATGVYWIPIYEILEARGIMAVLVNAHHVRNVPGRKSDVTDCEWLRELHSVGLLRGSFRPQAAIVALRSYLRHRESLTQSAATCVLRMQKELVQMNLQLHLVLTDITGQTGMAILRDIVAGHTDPRQLARHRDRRCQASQEQIQAALTGNYSPQHLFPLKQNLQLFEVIQAQIAECDAAIQAQLRSIPPLRAPLAPLGKARARHRAKNEPVFDVRSHLHQLLGLDLTRLDAIGPTTGLRLISEIGTDMTRWPTAHHFTSWLTLAPRNKISGGRLLSSRTSPSSNRAAATLRMAAMNLGRSQTALGAFYRRLSARIGKAKAVTATARKLAILVYHTLKGDFTYHDPGAAAYEARSRETALRYLRRRAKTLGYSLLHQSTGEVLA
jgi:transposase